VTSPTLDAHHPAPSLRQHRPGCFSLNPCLLDSALNARNARNILRVADTFFSLLREKSSSSLSSAWQAYEPIVVMTDNDEDRGDQRLTATQCWSWNAVNHHENFQGSSLCPSGGQTTAAKFNKQSGYRNIDSNLSWEEGVSSNPFHSIDSLPPHLRRYYFCMRPRSTISDNACCCCLEW
jgi:hypothetical protein